MDIERYFEPIDDAVVDFEGEPFRPMLGDIIEAYRAGGVFPQWEHAPLVLLGVKEDRGSANAEGAALAPDYIRRKLYRLARPHEEMRLVDLGNMMAGEELRDTHFAVIDVLQRLLDAGCTVLLLGGTDDLVFPIYKAYEVIGRVINICAIDSRFNLEGGDEVRADNYLQHIIMQQPNYLFDYTNLGYQTYFVGQPMVRLMEELHFGVHRVGEVQQRLDAVEPMIRYSDVVAVDVSAVRQGDAPAASNRSPHGLYGEELCQLARYAGMSDKTSCFAITEMVPARDRDEQTAHMLAQALWFFIEGFYFRVGDNPTPTSSAYKRFAVQMNDGNMEIVFYKSMKSDRWWMEVPCDDQQRRERYLQHTLIPCSYADYEQAMQNDVPELWAHYYGRFNG